MDKVVVGILEKKKEKHLEIVRDWCRKNTVWITNSFTDLHIGVGMEWAEIQENDNRALFGELKFSCIRNACVHVSE